MTKSAARWNLLFRAVFVLLLTFAVVEGFNVYFDLQASVYFIIVAELILIAAVTVIGIFKNKPLTWILLFGFIFVGLVSVHYFVKPIGEIYAMTVSWIENAIDWFISYVNQTEEPKLIQVELYYVLAMACAAILVCVLVLYPLSWNSITRCITSLLVLGGLIALSILGIEVNKASICCAYVCIATAVVELCNRQFEKTRENRKSNASLFLYPVCIIIALAAIIFPTKPEPIRWQKIRDAYDKLAIDTQSAVDTIKIVFRVVPDKFAIGNDGEVFVGRKKTMDTSNYETLAYIDVIGGTNSNLYIRGSASSTYTGRGWTDESAGVFTDKEPSAESYEIMYAMLRDGLMPEPDEDLFNKVRINIYYNRLITKSLFYSPMTTSIKVRNEKDKYSADGPNIIFKKMKKIGFSYSYDYYETNWGSETLANYLRGLEGYEYDDHSRELFADLHKIKGSAYSEIYDTYGYLDPEEFNYLFARSLPARADEIDKLYTALPEDLPESVYEFARELTKGCATEYDKIVAIEKYFSENYSYALDVMKLPKNRDFVDWFITEQTEGYCTHFATASAVLCRCLGIPARYVEGFMINEALGSVRGMAITNRDAHAWCEVYIEGFGWMILESTPGYGIGRNSEWARKKLVSGGSNLDHNDDFEQSMIDEANKAEEETPVIEVEPLTPEQIEAMKAERRAAARKFWTYTSIITTSVLVVGITVIVIVARRKKARRYNRATPNEKIRILMGELLLLAEVSDKKMAPSDTLNEFVDTLDDRYDTHDVKLRGAADMFLKIRYSSYEATRYEVLNMYRYVREVRRNILRKQNIFKRIKYSIKLYM